MASASPALSLISSLFQELLSYNLQNFNRVYLQICVSASVMECDG